MSEPTAGRKPPGFLWVVLLGAAGFCSGFFGPMLFVPEANQGPLVGIFISGPAGIVLGLVFWVIFLLVTVSGRAQWRLLGGLCTAGIIATLLAVQPEPATKGYLYEVEIRGHRPPAATADKTVADWKQRIAGVTWAQPRAGWEAQMRAVLAADQGLVLDTVLLRQRSVMIHRKPWNRGRLFATAWVTKEDTRSFYFPAGSLSSVPAPAERLQFFLPHDSTARTQAPDIWPPTDVAGFILMSVLEPVPEAYRQL